jgi:transposase
MKKTPGKTPAARERYWTKIIEEARRYEKGVTEYCRIMNISKNNYYFWFKRLRPMHPEWHDLTNHPEAIVARKPQTQRRPDSSQSTEVIFRTQRRKWSATEKERVLKEADALSGGDLSAFLRREGLYVHTLTKWRTQRDLLHIANGKRGNGAPNPLSAENRKLKEENARLQRKLQQANDIILLQKQISQMLSESLDSTEDQQL